MDAHKNFFLTSVVTPPTPADSGTQLGITAGTGADAPATPFNLVVFPYGEIPTKNNAEIIRVIGILGDTLTILREQEGTTARTIVATDRVGLNITAKVLTDIEDAVALKEPLKSDDDNYVTDAQIAIINNTSNINSGDNATNTQYSGLDSSKQDTLVSSTNIKSVNGITLLGSGDLVTPNTTYVAGTGLSLIDTTFASIITQYTDELAQDAVGSMVNSTLTYTDGTPELKVSNPVTPAAVGFTITAGTTPKTLTVGLDAIVSGTNTGDQTLPTDATLSFTDITTNNASTTKHGFLPKLPAPTGLFLKDDGTWAAPTGAGDMVLASVQSVTGLKTFDKDKIAMKGTSTGKTVVSTANTSATDYIATLPAKDGTIAMTSDIPTVPVKATSAEINTGTDDAKFVTAAAIAASFIGVVGGWSPLPAATYVSSDAPIHVISFAPGTASSFISKGSKIKLTDNSTVKYFIVVQTATDGGGNLICYLYGGTDYSLTGGAVSNLFFALNNAPVGFPRDPSKWTVIASDTTNRAQATPTQNTWYNLGSVSISIPIGCWKIRYSLLPYSYRVGTANNIQTEITLSTTTNSVTDTTLSGAQYVGVLASNAEFGASLNVMRPSTLTLASKTAYYLLTRTITTNISSLSNQNGTQALNIIAECAYL